MAGRVEQHFREQVLKILECPVCFDYMKAPIPLCFKGHSICKTCIGKVDKCPICRSTVQNPSRNYSLEKLSELLMPYTPYKVSDYNNRVFETGSDEQEYKVTDSNKKDTAEQGYKLTDYNKRLFKTGSDQQGYKGADGNKRELKLNIAAHTSNIIRCPLFKDPEELCLWKGLREHILDHVKIKHPSKLFRIKSHQRFYSVLDFRREDFHDVTILDCDGIVFISHDCYDENNSKYWKVIQYLEPGQRPSSYKCVLEILSGNKSKQLEFHTSVYGFDEDIRAIMDTGGCIEVSSALLQPCLSNGAAMLNLCIVEHPHSTA